MLPTVVSRRNHNINKMKLIKNPKMNSVPALLALGKSVMSKMLATPAYFSGAATLLATMQTDWNTLNVAQANASKGSISATTTRNLALVAFKTQLMILVLYVDVAAFSNVAEAADIIASAGLTEKKSGAINVQDISAKTGPIPGSVILRSKRLRGYSYLFQQSSDITNPDGWNDIFTATTASVLVSNLTPVTMYWFRVAFVKGISKGAFSKPAFIVVL
jgi:hypothetical protein